MADKTNFTRLTRLKVKKKTLKNSADNCNHQLTYCASELPYIKKPSGN
jgi:hypothetical protein